MNIGGLILEGVSGTGKTTLLRALRADERLQGQDSLSLLCLSEHHTQRVLEPRERAGLLTAADHRAHLHTILDFLSGIDDRACAQDWCLRGKTAHRVRFLLERFHLTHLLQYPYLSGDCLREIDERLAELNARLILLTAPQEALERRLADSGRDPGWSAYMRTLVPESSSPGAYFYARQQRLLELAAASGLPCRILDTAALSAADLTRAALDFLPF